MFLDSKLPSVYRLDSKAQAELLAAGRRRALKSGRWWALQFVNFTSLAVYTVLLFRYLAPLAYFVFAAWLCVSAYRAALQSETHQWLHPRRQSSSLPSLRI